MDIAVTLVEKDPDLPRLPCKPNTLFSQMSSIAQNLHMSNVEERGPIPVAICKNLSERSYDKRKVGALEIEKLLSELNELGDVAGIRAILHEVNNEFLGPSASANRCKGGLIAMAAAAIALGDGVVLYLGNMLDSVIRHLSHEDPRVRYYACESIYNISKVARGHVLVEFNRLFERLCSLHADTEQDVRNGAQLLDRLIKDIVTETSHFDLPGFIPLLRDTVEKENRYIRQLVIGWVTVLDSVPELDMLQYLPEILAGLFDMLADNVKDIRQQADACLHAFLLEIKDSLEPGRENVVYKTPAESIALGLMVQILIIQCQSFDKPPICRVTALNWMLEFIDIESKRGFVNEELIGLYGDMVGAVLICISDEDDHIRLTAEQMNSRLLSVFQEIKFEVEMKECIVQSLIHHVMLHLANRIRMSPTRTRITGLKWVSVMFEISPESLDPYMDELLPSLFTALMSTDEDVVLLDIRVLAKLSSLSPTNFDSVLARVVAMFRDDSTSFEERAGVIIRRLCVLLDAETIYLAISRLLEAEADLEFASRMIETLNMILFTATELYAFRDAIKREFSTKGGGRVFNALYRAWCHNPVSTLSLCILSQAYELGSALVFQLYNRSIPFDLPCIVLISQSQFHF